MMQHIVSLSNFWTCCAGLFISMFYAFSSNAVEPVKIVIKDIPSTIPVNLGTLDVDVESDFDVHLVNGTADDLTLSSMDASCGCVTASTNGSKISQGSHILVKLRVKPSSKVDEFGQVITVKFAEASVYPVSLNIKGKNRRDIVLNPNVINFGGDQSHKSVLIIPSGKKISILDCTARRGIVSIEEQSLSKDGSLSLKCAPEISIGQGIEVLLVTYKKDGVRKSVEVPLSVATGSKYRLMPSALDLTLNNKCDTTKLLIIGEDDHRKAGEIGVKVLGAGGLEIPRSSVSIDIDKSRKRVVEIKVCVLNDAANPKQLVVALGGQQLTCELGVENEN